MIRPNVGRTPGGVLFENDVSGKHRDFQGPVGVVNSKRCHGLEPFNGRKPTDEVV